MRRLHGWAILSVFSCCSFLFADQVVIKNGDRITGTIEKSDGKTVVIKTDFAGEITVQWDQVKEITSDAPLHVVGQGGKTAVGPVVTTDATIAVKTTSAGTVDVPKGEVTALRSEAEEAAYQKTLHPSLLQGWNGGGTVGFALTRGNSETKSLSVAFTGDRKTTTDEISMYANTVYSTNDAARAVPSTTANATQGGARYSRNLTKRVFAFVGADFQTDALQALNLRSIFGGGLGYHVIANDKTIFDLLGGVNYTRENYVGLDRNLIALTLGEELTQKLGASTVLTEKGYYFPDLNETGEYRATFNLGTITKINKWLGWQNAFGDIYVTNPPVGKRDNDLLLTTGLNFSFTH